MATVSLTPEGQITLPVEVREDLGLKPGDQVSLVKSETGDYVLKAKTGSVLNLRGIFKHTGPPVSAEEMNEAVAEHVLEDWKRFESQ